MGDRKSPQPPFIKGGQGGDFIAHSLKGLEMSFLASIPIIGQVLERGLNIIDKIVPDKDLAEQLKHEYQMAVTAQDYSMIETEIQERAKIIVSEATGQSWLQRNWRPVLMLTIVAVIANNYLIFPYASLFTAKTMMIELPERLWSLMELGVGGYVVGRTAEKCVETWKKA